MMSLFSYQLSKIAGEQFREPQILSALLKRLGITKHDGTAIDGWLLHYFAGLLFVLVYDQIWKKKVTPSVASGMALGAISGIVGAETWRKVYEYHPNPPKNNFKQYYVQLIPAHVIFGLFAEIGYKLPDNVKAPEKTLPVNAF